LREMILAASAAIFRDDGKVLLAKRTKPPFKWSFPGGSLEPRESAAEAAIREVREEVSVEIEIIAKAGELTFLLLGKYYVITVFAARLVSGEAATGVEASEIGWFNVSEIAALDTTEGLAHAAKEAQRVFLAAKA
jgi:8-oxo-dGTP diphosphatase